MIVSSCDVDNFACNRPYILRIFSYSNVFIIIHEYAIICISEHWIKVLCLTLSWYQVLKFRMSSCRDMSTFVGTSQFFRSALCVAMETMQIHIAQMGVFYSAIFFIM